MRKPIYSAAAAALSLVMAAGMAACGGETERAEYEAPAFDMPDVTISIGESVSGARGIVSDELYGVFLEDINYASQALDDNLVINGSFESSYQKRDYGWRTENATLTIESAGGVLDGLYEDHTGTDVNPNYALVTAQAGGSVINEGYKPVPMAVEEGVEYVFSAFIKAESGAASITVELTDGETVYASAELEAPQNANWIKYRRTMQATATGSEGLYLRLVFGGAATVGLDGVSCETTDSTAGIKNYLYEAVADLTPRFIRFPGGCIIEGENDRQAYDWKNSIGAVTNGANAGEDDVPAFTYLLNDNGSEKSVTTYGEAITRKPNVNLWENNGTQYYQMDYSLGFYDYFLLCESVGATALPVVNCGLSCQGQAFPGAPLKGRHGKGIEDFIQDALDLVEFARGDEDTKWGAVRAAMGHPEPFDMHYIGIGNEQWNTGDAASNYYTTYYEKFVEAFRDAAEADPELYGDVELIVGNHQQLCNCEGYEGDGATGGDAKNAAIEYRTRTGGIETLGEYGIQDHHYYNSPVDFFLHTDLYDDYTREGENRYEVFVGEYSANNAFQYSGDFSRYYQTNNVFSALSEAAMMTGFERNGDIVRLAAYAPMFASYSGERHWAVDMMLYTNTELVLTPNYYVQWLFMHNAGTRQVSSEAEFDSAFEQTFTLTGLRGAEAELNKLYYVVSLDEEANEIIVKLVNAHEDDVYCNLAFSAKLKAVATVTELTAGNYSDVSTLTKEAFVPETYTIGSFSEGTTAGYALPGYSVAAIRFKLR